MKIVQSVKKKKKEETFTVNEYTEKMEKFRAWSRHDSN